MKQFSPLYLAITAVLYVGLQLGFNAAQAQYNSYSVAEYRYEQFSSSGHASINLFDASGTHIGILVFYPRAVHELPDASQDAMGLVRLYFTADRLPAVIDQLRNESPIKLNYWLGREQNSHIATAKREPVGEGE